MKWDDNWLTSNSDVAVNAVVDWREWTDARAAGEGSCSAQEDGGEDSSGE